VPAMEGKAAEIEIPESGSSADRAAVSADEFRRRVKHDRRAMLDGSAEIGPWRRCCRMMSGILCEVAKPGSFSWSENRAARIADRLA